MVSHVLYSVICAQYHSDGKSRAQYKPNVRHVLNTIQIVIHRLDTTLMVSHVLDTALVMCIMVIVTLTVTPYNFNSEL